MRLFLGVLAVIFLVVGFFAPFAWGASLIFGILAIGDTQSVMRADDKGDSGGLLH